MAGKADKKQLSKKERAFVREYAKDCNATSAAERAGYAPTTANKKAPMWVGKSRAKSTKPHVWDAVDEAQRKLQEKTGISVERVVEELATVGMLPLEDEKIILGVIRTGDKLKALELLGKHLGMFKDVVEHSGPGGGPIPVDLGPDLKELISEITKQG